MIKDAKKKAWDQFSKYVRLRDSIATTGTTDKCRCVTCGKINPTKMHTHAGHVIPGRTAGILFDERGVNGQCRWCNRRGGQQAKYQKWYIRKHGLEAFDDMVRRRNKSHRWDVPTLEGIEAHYAEKTKLLLSAFNCGKMPGAEEF